VLQTNKPKQTHKLNQYDGASSGAVPLQRCHDMLPKAGLERIPDRNYEILLSKNSTCKGEYNQHDDWIRATCQTTQFHKVPSRCQRLVFATNLLRYGLSEQTDALNQNR
jgi:hypothetical protein